MGLIESMWVGGVSCDVRDCDVQELLPELVPSFGAAFSEFRARVFRAGWAMRVGRSNTWFCPGHADRASRCLKRAYGRCSPWCPVHRDGRVLTGERTS